MGTRLIARSKLSNRQLHQPVSFFVLEVPPGKLQPLWGSMRQRLESRGRRDHAVEHGLSGTGRDAAAEIPDRGEDLASARVTAWLGAYRPHRPLSVAHRQVSLERSRPSSPNPWFQARRFLAYVNVRFLRCPPPWRESVSQPA